MKLIVPVVGIVGGMCFGSLGILPLLNSASSSDGHRVVAQKPIISSATQLAATKLEVAGDDSTDQPADTESTLRRKIEMLEQGADFLKLKTDYTGRIFKQEVVKGELLDEQVIFLKCRQKPFSVYLVWEAGDVGREVIFIKGQNDDKMIAHDGGWKARIPAFTLPVDCALVMRDARYPVTCAGLMGLIDTMLGVHRDDLNKSNVASCVMESGQEVEGRPCWMFTTRYKSKDESQVYRKSVTLIDQEWNLPLRSQHFEWPRPGVELAEAELDNETIIESYLFSDVKFDQNLTDRDFDRTNSDYKFH